MKAEDKENISEDYESQMIEWYNTSHTPNSKNCLNFLNDKTESIIAWDNKSSGWLRFDFQIPILMVKTRINNGGGIWEIQFSDDKIKFHTCSENNISNGIKEVKWDKSVGAHRYWRYNLKKNGGCPYDFGFEWYFLGSYNNIFKSAKQIQKILINNF